MSWAHVKQAAEQTTKKTSESFILNLEKNWRKSRYWRRIRSEDFAANFAQGAALPGAFREEGGGGGGGGGGGAPKKWTTRFQNIRTLLKPDWVVDILSNSQSTKA